MIERTGARSTAQGPAPADGWMRAVPVEIRPGEMGLDEWREIYRGAPVSLSLAARSRIEAGAGAIRAVLARGAPIYGINTGFGKLANVRIADGDLAALQRNLVLSHAAGTGEPLPQAIVRLIMALKASSLGHGASGVRWQTVEQLMRCLDRGIVPLIPAQGSVGASGDLAPLAHMSATLMGIGDAFVDGRRMRAAEALAEAGVEPLALGPKEGLALLNGTQASTAIALAALFETERLFQTALIAGALSTDAAKGSDTPFDPRIQSLRGHRGQIETAAALRALIAGSAIRLSHLVDDDRIQDPYCIRCQPQVLGAALDLLRHAAATLATEADGVTDNPLVFADSGEVLSGGNFHAEPVAFASDVIAMALCEIGSISERRIAMLIDPALSRLPAFLTSKPGINSGFMIPQVTAAALVSENKMRAHPASVDSIPTSANQEDHVSMATHGAYRLLAMAENVAAIIAIELIVAAQACDFHAPLRSSEALERVRATLRDRIPHLEEDRYIAADIEAAVDLVRSGSLVEAAGIALPRFNGPEA